MFYIKENFITKKECEDFILMSKSPSEKMRLKYDFDNNPLWEERLVYITEHPIVKKVQKHFKDIFNFDLKIDEAQIQNWIIGSNSPLHTHIRRPTVRYNSLLYLNDNYDGGEFKTEFLSLKPQPGMLTLFDGQKTLHGLNTVKNKDRFTIIFWWKK